MSNKDKEDNKKDKNKKFLFIEEDDEKISESKDISNDSKDKNKSNNKDNNKDNKDNDKKSEKTTDNNKIISIMMFINVLLVVVSFIPAIYATKVVSEALQYPQQVEQGTIITETPIMTYCSYLEENLPICFIKFLLVVIILIYIGIVLYSIIRKIPYKMSQILLLIFGFILSVSACEYPLLSISGCTIENQSESTELPHILPDTTLKKPILYLYPEKEENVTIKLENEELLMTTYPKYNNGWDVIAYPDGSLYDSNNNYYYALYWDEKNINNCKFEDGFYVESEDAIKFLEEKLTIIGLSPKERNEFIMYWLPVLEQNKKSLVQFDLTEEIESNGKLLINPKQDSMLRVHINIKKVDKKTNIKEQKLTTFERSGFTAVEWGGTTY